MMKQQMQELLIVSVRDGYNMQNWQENAWYGCHARMVGDMEEKRFYSKKSSSIIILFVTFNLIQFHLDRDCLSGPVENGCLNEMRGVYYW